MTTIAKVPAPACFPVHAKMGQDFDAQLDAMASEHYTVRQLQDAFNMVADTDNWKAEVSAVVHPHFRAILEEAIPFMTGSVANFQAIEDGDKLWVQAIGYYEAVGA